MGTRDVKGSLSLLRDVKGKVSGPTAVAGELTRTKEISIPEYEGAYRIVPSEETQILSTADKKMAQEVVIEPIPSNYGRITWNGITLTVW